jgi:hypothetical protein
MLASMKADDPTVVEHPEEDEQIAFWPWVPCAFARIGETENQAERTAAIAKNIRPNANLVVSFMFPSPSSSKVLNLSVPAANVGLLRRDLKHRTAT